MIHNSKFIIHFSQRGQSLVELLIAIGLIAIFLPALATGLVASREGKAQEGRRLKAVALLREAEEAVRNVREKGWATFANNGTFHPEVSGSSWTLISGSEAINGYSRQVVVSDVYRDSSGNIVETGGSLDQSTKKVVASVSWSQPIASLVQSSSYFQRYLGNTAWTETTQADFDAGILTNTVTTNNEDGEVELAISAGGGSWASPVQVASYDNNGIGNGNDVFIEGDYAYLVTDNSGGNPDLAIVNISNPSSPSEEGTLNLNTNVNGIHTSENFAYLATSDDLKELIVVDISNKTSPQEVLSLNLGNDVNALDVFVSGSGNKKFVFVGKQSAGGGDRELYIVSVNSCFDVNGDNAVSSADLFLIIQHFGEVGPSIYDLNGDDVVSGADLFLIISRFGQACPHPPVPNIVGSFEVGGGGASANAVNGIHVSNNTVYLATSRDDKEFIVLDVSDVRNPQEIGFYNIFPGDANANDVHVVGNNAYLVTNNQTGSNPEFLILDISNPTNLSSSSPLGLFNVDGNTNAVWILGNFAHLATDIDNKEFIVLDVLNFSSISEIGFYDLDSNDGDANGIFVVGDYAYLATDHNLRELQILKGGAGSGGIYETSGTFESQSFDTGAEVAFNYLLFTFDKPASTNIQIQVAINSDNSTWNYFGPDGTSLTFYQNPGAIPLTKIIGRYIRYEAFLTGDSNTTPVLKSVSVNYSP